MEPSKGHVYVGKKWLLREEKLLGGFYLTSSILGVERRKEMIHDLHKILLPEISYYDDIL